MNLPDPDKDILDRLDTREQRDELRKVAIALVPAAIAALAGYEIMKRFFHWEAHASFDGAALVFIASAAVLCWRSGARP